jgi:hypothetical protein
MHLRCLCLLDSTCQLDKESDMDRLFLQDSSTQKDKAHSLSKPCCQTWLKMFQRGILPVSLNYLMQDNNGQVRIPALVCQRHLHRCCTHNLLGMLCTMLSTPKEQKPHKCHQDTRSDMVLQSLLDRRCRKGTGSVLMTSYSRAMAERCLHLHSCSRLAGTCL